MRMNRASEQLGHANNSSNPSPTFTRSSSNITTHRINLWTHLIADSDQGCMFRSPLFIRPASPCMIGHRHIIVLITSFTISIALGGLDAR